MAGMIMNEKIKALEVCLTGLNNEDLGIVSREEALQMAKDLRVDLVCESLMSSPPPCRLVAKGQAKQQRNQAKKQQGDKMGKVKEIRLTPEIEEHDYDTKLRQAEKLLQAGNAVLFTVKINGKQAVSARQLLERALQALQHCGSKQTGIQVSGKQVAITLLPKA